MVGLHDVTTGFVDVDLAELQFARQAHDTTHISGKDVSRQSIPALIGKAHSFAKIADPHDRDDWAKDLVLHDIHSVVINA
jgi:hypothetical protein